MMLIGLAGPAGVGKDSIADYLVEQHDFTKFSFSDALYREVSEAFRVPEQYLRDRHYKELPVLKLEDCNDSNFLETVCRLPDGPADGTVLVSPRWVLQRWGTDYRRAQNPNYWLEQSAMFVKAWLEVTALDGRQHGGLVNTSVRFDNERAFIKALDGVVWHVRRKAAPVLEASTGGYVSEQPLEVLPGESVIHNDHTLAHLGTGVSLLMQAAPGAEIRVEPPREDTLVTCRHCGWIHMAFTRAQAEAEVLNFNAWYETQTTEVKSNYSGPAAIEQYIGCDRCGKNDFRVTEPGDAPPEITINPVIYEPAR